MQYTACPPWLCTIAKDTAALWKRSRLTSAQSIICAGRRYCCRIHAAALTALLAVYITSSQVHQLQRIHLCEVACWWIYK